MDFGCIPNTYIGPDATSFKPEKDHSAATGSYRNAGIPLCTASRSPIRCNLARNPPDGCLSTAVQSNPIMRPIGHISGALDIQL